MKTHHPLLIPLILVAAAMTACASPAETPQPVFHSTKDVFHDPVLPFEVMSGSITIAGDVHRAPGSNPHDVMIVIGGSGSHLRSDVAPAIPMFLNDEVAVAIFDRRGSGSSTGTLQTPGTINSEWQIPVLADDVSAVANSLSAMGFERIGVVGSSMGGWISIAAAARSDLIDYVVAINGGASSVAVSDAFDSLTNQGLSIDQAIIQLDGVSLSKSYSPEADLARIDQPILWIMGELDDSNPTQLDLEVVERWKQKGKRFQTIVIDGADHNFINVETGEPSLAWLQTVSEFARIEGRQ